MVNLNSLLSTINLLLVDYYGWVLLVWVGLYMWYELHIYNNQVKFYKEFNWIFLEIKIDETNERSPLAMEQVFAALHAIHTNITWGEKIRGKLIPSTSAEIVSIGGRVSYIIKIVDRYRNLLESAIFAQYPKAEIVEVQDYLANLPRHYDPDTAEFDFWGAQLNKRKEKAESCYPIRTYGGFEHTEQDTIIDPLASVLETMSNLQPYELMATQILFKPVQANEWQEPTKDIINKLKGVPKKTQTSIFSSLMSFPLAVIKALVDIVIPAGESKEKPQQKKDEPPSLMLHLSEGEKQTIAAIEHQLGKISYETKVRILYMAPKGKLNKSLRVPEIIGAYRNFDDPSLNGLKPDMNRTATGVAYKYFETLEKPLRQRQEIAKKRRLWRYFKDRDHRKGSGKAYFNTEELATIFHFPQSPNVRVSQLERVSAVKSAPPPDLPIG